MSRDKCKVYVLTLNIKKNLNDTITYVKGVYSSRESLREGIVKVIREYSSVHPIEEDEDVSILKRDLKRAISSGEKYTVIVSNFNTLYMHENRCYLEVIKKELE